MAITCYDDIVSGFSSGTISDDRLLLSTVSPYAAPRLMIPAGTGSSTTGVICDASTEKYAPWFPLPGAGDSLLIDTGLEGIAPPTLLCDLLWACTFDSGGTTWVTSTDVYFTPPDLTRYTNGDNVYLVCEVTQATGMQNSSLILYVTDNLGRTNQALPHNLRAADYSSVGTGATSLWHPSYYLPAPAGAGGVRKLERMRFMTDASISNWFSIRFGLVRPLCFLPSSHGQGPSGQSFSERCSNIIRLYRGSGGDQACLVAIAGPKVDGTGTRTFSLAAA